MEAKLKTCIQCGIEQPLENFSKNKQSPDGLKCYCKACVKIQTAAYREQKHEEINQRKRIAWHKMRKTAATAEAEQSGVKKCSTCGETKPISDFYRRGNGNLYSRCKACESAAQRAFRVANPEHITAQNKAYNRAHKAQIDAYNHQYSATHSAQNVARAKKWYHDNPEQAKALSRRAVQRRNARKRALPATFTEAEWTECKQYFDHECAYCGARTDLTQDHVIPVSKGGGYVRENIIPACGCCNSRKINHEVWSWFRAQSFYTPEREAKIRAYLESFSAS